MSMRTIGSIIRETRLSKEITLSDLSKSTKVKKDFLESIEKEEWDKLPEYVTVSGFVKRIAQTLDLNENKLIAILKRDYPPIPIKQIPRKEIKTRFIWQPKYTFFVLTVMITLLFLGYITMQYISFNSPPPLIVYTPSDNELVKSKYTVVRGLTSPDATVKVNNQTAYVEKDGRFFTEIEVGKETGEIVIKAISRVGKENVKKIIINVQE